MRGKKPDLAVVIASGKPQGAPPAHNMRLEGEPMDKDGEGEGGDEVESAYHDAISEMGDAIHAKDWGKASEAFKTLHALCSAAESEEHDDDAEEEREY